jgi:3-dehydroquinate dehydratase
MQSNKESVLIDSRRISQPHGYEKCMHNRADYSIHSIVFKDCLYVCAYKGILKKLKDELNDAAAKIEKTCPHDKNDSF